LISHFKSAIIEIYVTVSNEINEKMRLEEYSKSPLWPILVETVRAMIMYPRHKAYVRDVLIQEQPNATPQDVAAKLGIPLGEALVILYELKNPDKTDTENVET